jgi:hypothetical protein
MHDLNAFPLGEPTFPVHPVMFTVAQSAHPLTQAADVLQMLATLVTLVTARHPREDKHPDVIS